MKKNGKNMDRIYDFRIGFYSLTAEEKEHRLWMLGRDPEICRLALATADEPVERARVAAEAQPSQSAAPPAPAAQTTVSTGAPAGQADATGDHGWGAAFAQAGYPTDAEPKPGAGATPAAAADANHGWDQAFAACGTPAKEKENQ